MCGGFAWSGREFMSAPCSSSNRTTPVSSEHTAQCNRVHPCKRNSITCGTINRSARPMNPCAVATKKGAAGLSTPFGSSSEGALKCRSSRSTPLRRRNASKCGLSTSKRQSSASLMRNSTFPTRACSTQYRSTYGSRAISSTLSSEVWSSTLSKTARQAWARITWEGSLAIWNWKTSSMEARRSDVKNSFTEKWEN